MLETGEISDKLGRGRHTTREAMLFRAAGGYIADTPGFSSLELPQDDRVPKAELAGYFPEFRDYLDLCRFSTCSHTCDKGCGVLEALKLGKIEPTRHESYVMMYNELKDKKEWEK